MNRRCRQLLAAVTVILVMAMACAAAVYASDDNSLADLGIKTPGATVSPEFRYDIWEYSVEVPEGTKTLELDPHTTNPTATVNSVTGTTLDPDGTGKVVITVTSESGNAIEYVLNVSQARGAVDPAAAIAANESSVAATIDTEVVQSEVETEDPRYVKVDRNSLQDAENTIEKLQKTITEQRNHINMLTYVLYALIAVSIIFLFIVISQLLRRRDIAAELAFYKQGSPYGTGAVAEDGWGEWGDDEGDRSGRKRKKNAPEDDGWDDGPADSSTSWVDQQVGTPVRPQNHPARSGQYPAGGQAQNQGKGRQARGARGNQYPNGGQAPDQARGRQARPQDARARQQAGPSGETKRYEAVPPVHPQQVPKDVTKDLTRVNKAEEKAMKKAAAAEAKREAEAKKAAQARAEEAKRQALEAQRIEQEQEAARRAQEEALEKAASQEAGKRAGDAQSSSDGNVKINMIDL